jgi:deoxyribonuclease-4
MPTPQRIGAHLSVSRGLAAMVHTAVEIGATCAQIFTASPQQWRDKTYAPADVEAFLAARAASDVGPIVAHESYLINLASSDPALLEKSRQAFRQELTRCAVLQLPLLVIHWGSFKGGTRDEGLDRLAESLHTFIPLAQEAGVQILLETTAGQGSYLGDAFAEFAALFDRLPNHEVLGVCLDTCHVFVAGYEIRTPEGYQALWEEFDREIGLARLQAIHLNGSAKPLGSHGDRHSVLGEGELGLEPFRCIMRDPRLAAVPKILEIPGAEEVFADNLAILRGFTAPEG